MAQKEGFWIAVAIVVAAVLIMRQPVALDGGGGGIDLCKVVDAEATFTGQRMFLAGTALTGQYVRVIKQNGGIVKDLGQTSMNSGTISTSPNGVYKLYFGENESGDSSTYYTGVEDYTAPCQDSADDKAGVLCQLSSSPTLTVFDENGQVNTPTSNAQAIGANEIVNVEVKVKAEADKCIGNPSAPSKNALCFEYNATAYDSVKVNTPVQSVPYALSTTIISGNAISCYEFDLLADTASQTVTVTIDASSTNPDQRHNITVNIADVGFDLDADTLDEIWGFEDESNNNIGYNVAFTADSIHIS